MIAMSKNVNIAVAMGPAMHSHAPPAMIGKQLMHKRFLEILDEEINLARKRQSFGVVSSFEYIKSRFLSEIEKHHDA